MIISYNWLLSYLPEPLPIEELSGILTSIGLEVESVETIEQVKGSLKGVVTGQVMECIPHPNADKLKKTRVDIGAEALLDIVCGAPNVAEGQKVLVATIGTQLHFTDGKILEIKAARIRGEASQGMICAEDELGLGNSHEGIMILPEDTPVGIPAKEYLKLSDPQTVIHIGLTPNRSDAMSHIGVAKDVCAYLSHHRNRDFSVIIPDTIVPAASAPASMPVEIEIKDTEKCARYAGISIAGVLVAESPQWLKDRLIAIGQKPINNIVDITNFVLHETGQPLHAFDYDRIKGHTILVQTLPENTPFTTLDGKERKLSPEDLMICDTDHALCIAGVMGGLDSGVSETTRNIFLESAWFHPRSVRRSSMRHQLRTEAAIHFEKTTDIENVLFALQRAAKLIIETAGGAAASDIKDIYPNKLQPRTVTFRYDYIALLCGKQYDNADIDNILVSLGFKTEVRDEQSCTVLVPFNKPDVHLAADIAEEVLRIDGLNNVTIPETISFSMSDSSSYERMLKEKMCTWLSSQGLNELVTNSIVNDKDYPHEDNIVRMINSLSSELNAMRPQMLQSGLEVLSYNINRGARDIAVYEWGHVYRQEKAGEYRQDSLLSIWVSGQFRKNHWQEKAKEYDVYYLKGIIEGLAATSGIAKLKSTISEGRVIYSVGKEQAAVVYEIPSGTLRGTGIKQAVYYAEINTAVWMKASLGNHVQYKELSKFPSVERDLAIVLNKNVDYGQIEAVIKSRNLPALRAYHLFDIYEGAHLGDDKRSWAINYFFQLDDRTLHDQEIDSMMQTLIQAYESDLNAEIRK